VEAPRPPPQQVTDMTPEPDAVPLQAAIEALRHLTDWEDRMGLAVDVVADHELSDLGPTVLSLLACECADDRRVGGDLLAALAEGDARHQAWALDRVRQLLDPSGEPVLLERVLQAAGAHRSEEFIDAFVAAAHHPDARVRRRVAAELGSQDEDVFPDAANSALVALAEADEVSVRDWALFALGHQRVTPLSTPAALRVYELNRAHPDDDVRCEALEALGRLGDVDALVQALDECYPGDELLEAACRAADSRLLPSLRALEQDSMVDQRRLAAAIAACSGRRRQPASAPTERSSVSGR